MSHPTTRLLTILELLQTYEHMSGAEIARRLEVSPRTIRRYMTSLQDIGIPIETQRGRYGAYRLRRGFKLPPLMLTDEEALAVMLGLLATRKMSFAVSASAVEGALAKIERVLSPLARQRLDAVQQAITFALTPAYDPPDAEVLFTVTAALRQSRMLNLRYRGWKESYVVLRCYAHNLEWIAYILAGLNCHLVILQPPELRRVLQHLATHINAIAAAPEIDR